MTIPIRHKRPIKEDFCDDHTSSDFLLAQAISSIENEGVNEYERPKGKCYRRPGSKRLSFPDDSNTSQGGSKSYHASHHGSSFPSFKTLISSTVSSDSDDNSEIINTDLIEFIGKKKNFILNLISDSSFSSEYYTRSERRMALHRCNSLRDFERNAVKEASLICSRMKEYVGSGFAPCEPYISHIFQEILTEKKNPNPDDICDYGGYFPVTIKIRKFNSILKTIEFIIFPEVLTEYLMVTKTIIL